METIIQKDKTGCGVACVAMIAGKTYEEVKLKANSLGIFTEDKKLWSETTYVRKLLKEYQISFSKTEEPFSEWAALPDIALLSIKYRIEHGKPFWHWTVFERKNGNDIVRDPAAYLDENERTDFESINPKWFIKIQS
jgi:ABC-type bacteriocin/lantibiotic exporter with double-glycine peptidase domain